MKKSIRSLLVPVLVALLSIGCTTCSFSQCDPGFFYSTSNNSTYHFVADQIQQGNYTYFHTWKRGSSVISSSPSFDYNFSSSGLQNICHKISIQDSLGQTICVDSLCLPVQVVINPPSATCFPSYYASYTKLDTFTVRLSSNLPNYTGVTILWKFGDGTTQAGVASPVHRYPTYGYFNACLVYTDTVRGCADSTCEDVLISQSNPCTVSATFSSKQPFFNASTLTFYNTVSNNFTNCLWDFGDGATSTTPNILHHYATYGPYLVKLYNTDTVTGCTVMSYRTVNMDTCSAEMGKFNFYSDSYLGVRFNTSNLYRYATPPVSLWWNFGDGDTSSVGTNVAHQYDSLGVYVACFQVTMPGCSTYGMCDTVVVECNVSASFQNYPSSSKTLELSAYSSGSNLPIRYNWIFGDGTKGDGNHPIHAYQRQGYYNVCVIATDTNSLCSDTVCQVVLATEWNDTICGHVFFDANINGIQDAGEPPIVDGDILYETGNTTLHVSTDSLGYFSAIVPFDSYLYISLDYGVNPYYTLPFNIASYTHIFPTPGMRQCGFDFGIVTNMSKLSGAVFADFNQNGIRDNSFEAYLGNEIVKAGNQSVITAKSGSYTMLLPTGNYTVTKAPGGLYASLPVSPSSIPVSLSTPGSSSTKNNFGIGIDSSSEDVSIELIPTSAVSPTRASTYKLFISNLSHHLAYIQGNIVSDNSMDFIPYNNTLFSANNPFTHTTSWLDKLYGFEQVLFDAEYDLSPGATINQDIYNTASIELMIGADANPANDTSRCHQIVVASYDPNNKLSQEAGRGADGLIQNNQELKYVINFQNTGTDYAVNVVLSDELDKNLDLQTFRFIGSSHNCDVRLKDDSLYFRFSKIMLPFEQMNGSESHGWVAFSIYPKPGLGIGTQLRNTAAIYFDHNPPVITNTTLHTVAGPNGLPDNSESKLLTIGPNPVNNTLLIRTENFEPAWIKIFDASGRIVMEQRFSARLDVRSLFSGIYFIEARDATTLVRKLFVKM
ncbi:MAG: PKD domain-containing protein [Bacteroidetes bacterium]|nr:PKD domain-containing protein [Bacteroidota bacterium]